MEASHVSSTHHMTHRRRRLLFLLTLLLLVSLACTLPGLQPAAQPQTPATAVVTLPAQTAEPAVSGAQAAQPEPVKTLPPALVEVDPLPHSELAPGDNPVFYFNQPMERASVEAAFQTQPQQNGRFEWIDDATLRFVPSASLAAGSGLQVTIDAGAKAANGLTLGEPVQVSYQGSGLLGLAERLPAPDAAEVNPSSAVVTTFTRPVVALGADPQSLPPAFGIDPAVPGRGEWINTSTYVFYPQPALLGGTRYTVRLNTSLTSVEGSPLAPETSLEWSFTTAAPVLLSVTPPPDQFVPLDSSFTLTFNQPMDTASVEADFSLIQQNGDVVAGKFTWNDQASEVTFQPENLLQRAGVYTIALFGTARSQGGSALGQDFAAVVSAVPEFAITQTRPATGETLDAFAGYGSIWVTFSSPVAAGQNFDDFISFDPPIVGKSVYRDVDGYHLTVSGYFEPSTSYTMTIAAGLRDRWDASLASPFSFTFSSQAAQPSLVIPVRAGGAQALFIPANETGIAATATNINRITLSRGRLALDEFIRTLQDWKGLQDWESRVDESWPHMLYLDQDVRQDIRIPLSRGGEALDPGLYFLNMVSQPVTEEGGSPVLLVVSPVQLILKTSARQAFAWAVRVPENTPVAGATITFYGNNAQSLGSCVTDERGACEASIPPREDPYQTVFAALGQPGERDFSVVGSNWYSGVAAWDFNLNSISEGGEPEVYLYTDRPIYRPGQTVNFRAVVREQDNGRYPPPNISQVTVEVVGPYDPLTEQNQSMSVLRLPLDEYGSTSGAYLLPADARPGPYSLRVQEVKYKEVYFEVAEYRKPEIDLQVGFHQKDERVGNDLLAQVTAHYYFGAPAGNLPVRWSLFRTRAYLDLPGGLSTGRISTSWLQPWGSMEGSEMYVLDGQSRTGADGTLNIRINGEDLVERLGDAARDLQDLTLEVTVEDESGLPVSARGSARLHPASYAVGAAAEQWTVQAGQEITYTVRSVDWQGEPLADRRLTARFRQVEWVREPVSDPAALPNYRVEYTEIGSTDFATSAQGDARLAFVPPEPGTYLLEINGEEGAVSEVLSWVGGPGSTAWPELPNQRLLLRSDGKQYQPGQTARIFIPNPFDQGALALVTVERGRVMRSWVTRIDQASYELQVPLAEEDAPNVYIAVTLLGRTGEQPDFRQGYLELTVDASAQLLQVQVDASPQQPQPGGDLTLNIRARDQQGSPVQAEFSLALVDKAALALADANTPSIVDALYGPQPLGVRSGFALVNYAGRFIYAPPGRGGGGGEAVSQNAVRTKFEDTAYWNGAVQTDVTGVAQIILSLPDNLTTWRVDVRGLTADARVGQAQSDLVTGKPLMISPVAPRFVVLDDHLELAAVVYNNTGAAQHASVRLETAGFALDDPDQAAQGIDLAAGERVKVSWWGRVQDVPTLDLVFQVDAGSLHDAARPEMGPLPVLKYAAPQSFGASGVLENAGERVELVSLPRSFTPLGAELQLELSPSLPALVLDGLEAIDAYPLDFTEPVLSRMLPNLAAFQMLKEANLQGESLSGSLEHAVTDGVTRLVRIQNEDGGWGWAQGYASNAYISSYVMFGLTQASQAGFLVEPRATERGQSYLIASLFTPTLETPGWQLDRLAFQMFALQSAGYTDLALGPLFEFREELSPWGKALLALTYSTQSPGSTQAVTLLSDLQATAERSASGVSWQDHAPGWRNWSSPNFTTAVVTYAMTRLDPAAAVLPDAVRFLVANRRPTGSWASSYETAWALLALVETARASGDLQSSYTYGALLNGSPLIDGRVENPIQAMNPARAQVRMANLLSGSPNELLLRRGEGSGRLYYRANLQVSRPARDAQPIQRGLTITREYYRSGLDCRAQGCAPIDSVDLTDSQPVLVRLTLSVPEDMGYVVVEDAIPAGTEVLNVRLKTSQQNIIPEDGAEAAQPVPQVNQEDPFGEGWGWWLFGDPQVYDDHIRWVVESLPAGTYQLTYRLTPYLAGEFQVIPAHAWQYYFPDVEGTSPGAVFIIR